MGSGGSRTARVTTARVTTARPAARHSPRDPVDLTQPRSAGSRSRSGDDQMNGDIPDCDLGESLDCGGATRLFTELQSHSAQSSGSDDSGVCDLEPSYGHVITERSAPDRVAQVERDFLPPPRLELEVVGKAVPRLLSGYQKNRLEEQRILHSLREEGLITTPAEHASSGVSFQIVCASSASAGGRSAAAVGLPARLPSATLDRLEARRHRHRRQTEPETDQLAKQRRRQEAEEERVRKLMLRKQQAEGHQHQRAEDKEVRMERRIGSAVDKRQRHLNDLRRRLRDKHDRGKQVPLRRALNTYNRPPPSPGDLTADRQMTPTQDQNLPAELHRDQQQFYH